MALLLNLLDGVAAGGTIGAYRGPDDNCHRARCGTFSLEWDLSCQRENKSSYESHFDVPTNCSALVRMYGLSSVLVTSSIVFASALSFAFCLVSASIASTRIPELSSFASVS
jgi:hypothetical protein